MQRQPLAQLTVTFDGQGLQREKSALNSLNSLNSLQKRAEKEQMSLQQQILRQVEQKDVTRPDQRKRPQAQLYFSQDRTLQIDRVRPTIISELDSSVCLHSSILKIFWIVDRRSFDSKPFANCAAMSNRRRKAVFFSMVHFNRSCFHHLSPSFTIPQPCIALHRRHLARACGEHLCLSLPNLAC